MPSISLHADTSLSLTLENIAMAGDRVAAQVGVQPFRLFARTGEIVDQALSQNIVDRDDEPAQNGGDGNAERDDNSQRVAAIRSRAGRPRHRQDAHHESERCHQNRS
jgi:hypothetical protein